MASYGLLLWGRARQLRPSLVRDPMGIPRSDWRAAPRNPIGATPSSLGWLISWKILWKWMIWGYYFRKPPFFWRVGGHNKPTCNILSLGRHFVGSWLHDVSTTCWSTTWDALDANGWKLEILGSRDEIGSPVCHLGWLVVFKYYQMWMDQNLSFWFWYKRG